MKPLHEILAAAKPYLLPAGVKDEEDEYELRICYAIQRAFLADAITDEEHKVGCECIMAKLRAQSPSERSLTLLSSVAWHNGFVRNSNPDSAEYIAFRDKWLDELIAEVTPK